MYLKSIEMQGFKSFANRMVLSFENGITGIVGPNGSGKSNIADAVRWVLGEQSAKELRGASMTDVIFEGTETRRALSSAYVAITIDNSDHTLPIEYDEVTVSRRVYRSGESEYMINGSNVRLKDINELFYDTGIGKEGYSIIGQGQIETILSGRPEEKRELIDEAVGIVKYKRRKTEAEKKLLQEHDDLTRINDILSELEKQVGPLKEQSENAKKYLLKKEELKKLDVNLFLMQKKECDEERKSIDTALENTEKELSDANSENDRIQKLFEEADEKIKRLDLEIEELRQKKEDSITKRAALNQNLSVLKERVRAYEEKESGFEDRLLLIKKEIEEKKTALSDKEKEEQELTNALLEVEERLSKITADYQALEDEIKEKNKKIDENKNEIVRILNERADIKSKTESNKTLLSQFSIRKSSFSKRLLLKKTVEEEKNKEVSSLKEKYEELEKALSSLEESKKAISDKQRSWEEKKKAANDELIASKNEILRIESALETLSNYAERYEGFGNAIKSVMDRKDSKPGIIGTVSDLITSEKKYENAIETALGGNIRNVVTKDEEAAKREITFLKENRLGRVTFLPLSNVKEHRLPDEDALSEKGVLGRASDLVKIKDEYRIIAENLLGGFLVCDNMESALSIQRKYRQNLRIVTLEGELLSPGGSITGGAFKKNAGLLGRNREIEELQKKKEVLLKETGEKKKRIEEIETAEALLLDDMTENEDKLSELMISHNTAKINYETAIEKIKEDEKSLSEIEDEISDADSQMKAIEEAVKESAVLMEESILAEKDLNKKIEELKTSLDEKTYLESTSARTMSEVQVEAESARQKKDFALREKERLASELSDSEKSLNDLIAEKENSKNDTEKLALEIKQAEEVLLLSNDDEKTFEEGRQEKIREREECDANYRDSIKEKEEASKKIFNLEKELQRLSDKKEKIEEKMTFRTDNLWQEYELAPHDALSFLDESLKDSDKVSRDINSLKNEIRSMGNVNVNAIEDYKEVSERYEFLKGQHDDLIEAEESLTKIINELTEGMKERFEKGFADIKKEFDRVFKVLFGGGKAELSLTDEENLLESGIRITCQPPGKKLQNMMQLSGGEKSLTAIALLFAIQNLKPSPFCLLDEIEAALDDSNVDRFAEYLHKLTKNTQFIIITHRRGTMKAADRLYGITMQEKGVSAQVSVSLVENDLSD